MEDSSSSSSSCVSLASKATARDLNPEARHERVRANQGIQHLEVPAAYANEEPETAMEIDRGEPPQQPHLLDEGQDGEQEAEGQGEEEQVGSGKPPEKSPSVAWEGPLKVQGPV